MSNLLIMITKVIYYRKTVNRYKFLINSIEMIIRDKAGLARGIQGTESLVVGSRLSVVVVPSRDGALGVIGVSGKISHSRIDNNCRNL